MGTPLVVRLPRQAVYEITRISTYAGVFVFWPQFSGIQISYFVFRILLSHLVSLVVPNFYTLSHKSQDFRRTIFYFKICFLIISRDLFKIFLVLGRIQRYVITNAHMSSCKILGYFCQNVMLCCLLCFAA